VQAETFLVTFLIFLTVAVLVAYAAARFRVPYTIAMVLVGLGVSFLHLGQDLHLTVELEPELILLIFLPGLLFEASYHIDLSLLRANLRTILLLAIPGVLISTTVVGLLINLELGLPLREALLFGVIISATDPVAVVALFKELGVDRRLGIIVEGESLFNDGVAIVGYSILVGILIGTDTLDPGGTAVDFVVTVAGGATLGLVLGFLFAELMKRTENPLIDIALTTILAYGAYFLAEEGLHGLLSPVIAVVVAGIVVGNYGSQGRHSATSTSMIITFWEFVVFLINSAVFLLIGLEVEISLLTDNVVPILLAISAVLIARAVVVYGLRLVINRRARDLPLRWAHVMFWGGLRGAVGIALVLSLPYAVASRGSMIALVFGCVLFSVIVQGLSIRPLLSRLGLIRLSEQQRQFEEAVAKVAAAQASYDALADMQAEHLLTRPMAEHLRKRFEDWIDRRSLHLFRMVARDPSLAEAHFQSMKQEISYAQKRALLRLLRRGVISEEVYADYVANIDELLRGPSTMDWILAAELKEGLENLPPEEPGPAEDATGPAVGPAVGPAAEEREPTG
jgi:CPA1 family monovalent cation:H+ antiporter